MAFVAVRQCVMLPWYSNNWEVALVTAVLLMPWSLLWCLDPAKRPSDEVSPRCLTLCTQSAYVPPLTPTMVNTWASQCQDRERGMQCRTPVSRSSKEGDAQPLNKAKPWVMLNLSKTSDLVPAGNPNIPPFLESVAKMNKVSNISNEGTVRWLEHVFCV
jgi:hypothetical protein